MLHSIPVLFQHLQKPEWLSLLTSCTPPAKQTFKPPKNERNNIIKTRGQKPDTVH